MNDDNVTNAPPVSEDEQLEGKLAAMHDLMYERARKKMAADLDLRVGVLDTLRAKAIIALGEKRRAAEAAGAPDDAWPVPVDGPQLAIGIDAVLRRFVVMMEHAYTIVTLWVIGTYCYAVRGLWPLLLIRSPQPACGKSTLLDTMERLVAQPMIAANASLATLFRTAAAGPTQLLDELDSWIARDPEVIGFLRAGWQTGRPFTRCNPETLMVEEFPCYSPKALAQIGDLTDDALRSRCVVVEMRRALPGERAERFRTSRAYPELADLCKMAMRWARDHGEEISRFEIGEDDLSELSARALDNAEALLAIATEIGGDWPEKCRAALLGAPVAESQDYGAMLLEDLSDLIALLPYNATAVDTARVIEYLLKLDDRPWPEFGRGAKPISAHALRKLLRPFGIRPERVHVGGVRLRGYVLGPIRAAIARYLTPAAEPSQVSNAPADKPRDDRSTPQSVNRDTLDASGAPKGPSGGNGRRIVPLAPGPMRDEFDELAGKHESDGLDRAQAELLAAEQLGLLLPGSDQ